MFEFITKFRDKISGYKTIFAALGAIAGAFVFYIDGSLDVVGLFQSVAEAVMIIFVRLGISKAAK